MAHFTSLVAARFALLKRCNWDVNLDGLSGAPQIRVFTSKHHHASIDRAVRFLGIGSSNIINLETDESERVTAASLTAAIEKYSGPAILVLDAADLNVTAFDPFDELIPIAQSKGIWVHVDGAFGLFARASESKKHLTKGLELADSWATDGHKWLNVPLNPEWSRRASGVAVYAALRELGRSGVEDLIDRSCAHCLQLVRGIGKLNGAEVVWEPILNQGLVRFLDLKSGATEEDHDRKTVKIMHLINQTGTAFFSGAMWKEK